MRRLVLTAALLCSTLSGLAGCKGACRELSEKLCDWACIVGCLRVPFLYSVNALVR